MSMIVKQPDQAGDLRLKDFARATGVFIRTPIRKSLGTLPERPQELGGRRKVFDLNVFVLESWRSVTGRKKFYAKSYEAMEAFSRYITRIDDILDTDIHPSINDWNISYRTDDSARKAISIFVNRVLEMEREKLLTPQETRQIFKAAGSYRRESRRVLEHFESLQNPQIDEILKTKERTTGGMGAVMVEIISVAERIPSEQQKLIAKAFSNSFMATQIADDMHDIHDDIRNKVPNIAVAVLQKYAEEFDALIENKSTDISSYKRLAPRAYSELMEIGQSYISRIPVTPESMGVLRAIPQLFYKIVQLTSRGG